MQGQAILQQLDMWSDSGPEPGLVAVDGWATRENLTPEEAVAAERAESMGANYVYLRHFEQSRPPVPQAYIYDLSAHLTASRHGRIDSLDCDLNGLQRRLWNASDVPLAFVFLPAEILVLNCFAEPVQQHIKPLAAIKTLAKVDQELSRLKAFSARGLDNGTFWDLSSDGAKIRASKSAYESLIRELGDVLREIYRKKLLPDDVARKLILVFVLLKYLEERRDNQGRGVFPSGFFSTFVPGARELTDVMTDGRAVLRLLDALSAPEKLNGDVFRLTDRERAAIAGADFERIAGFLRGDLEGKQLHLWRRYDFRYLPVELVSSIYEEFVTKADPEQRRAKGVVYTPAYLVHFLLDLTLPVGKDSYQIRVLDPACGSGVFLVGVFRRLVLRWRRQNGWQRPNLPTLKKILSTSIYGVDSDPDAVNVTIFSLAIALCDHLEPREIWEELHFDQLRDRNILNSDFFRVVLDGRWASDDKRFNLILGNPPFAEELTEPAKQVEQAESSLRPPIPQGQLALLFLEQAVKLTQPNAMTCLLQPAGPLLYNPTAVGFRSYLLSKWHIPQIIDFTHACRVVFGPGGDVPFAAAFAQNSAPTDAPLLHLTVRRTRAAKEKLFFEVDYYDFHHVDRTEAKDNPFIWKADLLGGGRLVPLLRRLTAVQGLEKFVANRKGWRANEGFIAGRSGGRTAAFLTGHPYLPTKALSCRGIDRNQLGTVTETYFRSTGDELIYHPPHLLVKEILQDGAQLVAVVEPRYLTFRDKIVGIHAPEDEMATLVSLCSVLRTKLSAFVAMATSAQYAVGRSTALLKADLMRIPVSDDLGQPVTTPTEEILIDDAMGPLITFRRRGEGSPAAQPPNDLQLTEFGNVFARILGAAYPQLHVGKPLCTDHHICYLFWFGAGPADAQLDNEGDLDRDLERLITHDHGSSLRIVRVLRFYHGNSVLLVKPRQLRYWLRSVAIRDADDIFANLVQQGY